MALRDDRKLGARVPRDIPAFLDPPLDFPVNRFKQALRSGRQLIGLWSSLSSAAATEHAKAAVRSSSTSSKARFR